VLANRLSKLAGTILVLERGQLADSLQSQAPLLSLAYSRNDDGVLKYDSAPQKHLYGSRKTKLIAGKLLGGSSRLNNGLLMRCQPAEFHDWGEGWTFDQLETLYNRSNSNSSDIDNANSNGEWKTRIVETFFESSKMYVLNQLKLRIAFLK
jgi:choline dehydrogenase